MKKLFAFLLAALLMISMTACIADPDDLANNPTEWKSSYVPSDKAEVVSSFVVADEAKFTIVLIDGADVEKVGIACLYFDKDGKALGKYEILTCGVDNDPLSSWETQVPDGCVYALATVAHTTDSDGNKETCEGVSDWAKETEEKFTVSGHKTQLDKWARVGDMAENCEYVKIESLECSGETLAIEVTNLTTEEIPTLQIYLLLFDEEGSPVDAGGNSCPNSKLVELTGLLAGETATYEYTIPGRTVAVRGVVHMVKAADGTIWNNPYIYDWLFTKYNVAP